MTTVGLVPVTSPASSSRAEPSWRVRWRRVHELLSGALILAIWLSLWSWLTFGVAAPLGRLDREDSFRAAEAADLHLRT